MEKTAEKKGRLLLFGLPAIPAALFFLLPLLIKSPLFCLNDDLQLRDILSGKLGGSPDLHAVYMRAPLSFLLSLLYRILPSVPWFGAFLCLCMAGCFYFLFCGAAFRFPLQARSKEEEGKAALFPALSGVLLLCALCLLFLLPVLIMPHYTLVAACCGATGLWLLLRKKEDESRSLDIPAFVLLILCDQIRSQVFLMLLPFAAAVVLLRLCFDGAEKEEKRLFLKKLVVSAVLWLVLLCVHKCAYLSYPWAEYLRLNDARTKLYDYSGVWESDAAKEYYEKNGMRTETTLPLYLNYDLLPDGDARTERLSALALYREESRNPQGLQKVKNVLYELRVRTLSPDRGEIVYAWPYLFTALAGLVFFALKKRWIPLLALLGGLCLHFGLYAYLLWNGRAPERVTVSLYLIGTVYAAGLLLREHAGRLGTALAGAAAAALFAASFFSGSMEDYDRQITVNQTDDVLYSYMAEHADTLFLLETYATVDRTTPVLREDGSGNVLLMGGWQYGSPLQEETFGRFGYTEREELFAPGGANIVFREGVGLEPEELEAFLEERYPEGGRLKLLERLEAPDATFLIYGME